MPLLRTPRKLKHGRYYYGQSLFNHEWKQYNTQCQTESVAESVVAAVEAFCSSSHARAKQLIAELAKQKSDAGIKIVLEGLKSELQQGRDPLNMRTSATFKTIAREYIMDRRDGWSPRTTKVREDTFTLIERHFAELTIAEIDKAFVTRFRIWLNDEYRPTRNGRLRPASVNIHLRNLRALLNWYADREDKYRAPRIRLTKAPGSEHRDSLTPDEFAAVLEQAKDMRVNGCPVGPFFEFLLLTGMRRGEALAAVWSWVGEKYIRVPAVATKTNAKRLVPITATLAKLLQDRPRSQSGRIFDGMTEKASKLFLRARKAAGIERPLHLHNLRDTFIVRALVAGVPAFSVAKIVGNSVKVIEEHYAQFSDFELQRAGQMLENA